MQFPYGCTYLHYNTPWGTWGWRRPCVRASLLDSFLFTSILTDTVIPQLEQESLSYPLSFLASRSDDGNQEVRHRPDRWSQLSGSPPLRTARPRTRARCVCALCLCVSVSVSVLHVAEHRSQITTNNFNLTSLVLRSSSSSYGSVYPKPAVSPCASVILVVSAQSLL